VVPRRNAQRAGVRAGIAMIEPEALAPILGNLPRPGDMLEILEQGPRGLFTVFTADGSMELLLGPAQVLVTAVDMDASGSISIRALVPRLAETLVVRWEHGTFHARSTAMLVRP